MLATSSPPTTTVRMEVANERGRGTPVEKVSKLEYETLPPPSSSNSADSPPLIVLTAILLYSVVSLSIVYFNWWLFTKTFRYPVFVSWIQQVVGFLLFVILALLGKRISIFSHFPLVWPKLATTKSVFLLTLSFVGMVGLANICLKFVQVSTYQVARSLTIFFTMALSFVMLGESQRPRTLLACSLMVAGFVVGSLDAATLSFIGMLAGGLSSIFQALYNVSIKRTLQYVNNDPNLLLYYNLWMSSLLFIPVIFVAGEGDVWADLQFDGSKTAFWAQWGSLFLSGLLATSMNLCSYWCVKVTSPLTFNIVGFSKSIVQTLGGVVFLGDIVSVKAAMGIFLSLLGSGWYSLIKVGEVKARAALSTAGGTSGASSGDLEMQSPDFRKGGHNSGQKSHISPSMVAEEAESSEGGANKLAMEVHRRKEQYLKVAGSDVGLTAAGSSDSGSTKLGNPVDDFPRLHHNRSQPGLDQLECPLSSTVMAGHMISRAAAAASMRQQKSSSLSQGGVPATVSILFDGSGGDSAVAAGAAGSSKSAVGGLSGLSPSALFDGSRVSVPSSSQDLPRKVA